MFCTPSIDYICPQVYRQLMRHELARFHHHRTRKTIDFLLTEQRDEKAARQFLNKAIGRHGGVPEKITIDGSAANEAAIKSDNKEYGTSIEIRQIKYLNNIVEQDHRSVKRVTRPMPGFKSFEAAQSTLTGNELMHMLRKGQLEGDEVEGLSAAEQFPPVQVVCTFLNALVRWVFQFSATTRMSLKDPAHAQL